MRYIKTYKLFEEFLIEQNTFKLLIGNNLVSEVKFNIEPQDEFFNANYVSIYEL